jgi:uncharacterized BrkB/YihY/UPF0761 family membrane protein
MDPAFFKKLQALSGSLSNLGWFGIIGSLIAASFLFSNLLTTINRIFRAKSNHSFIYNRLIEYVVMLLIGIFLLLSLSVTAVWIAFQQLLHQSPVFSGFINPRVVNVLNSFFFQSLLPFGLTFLMILFFLNFIRRGQSSGLAVLFRSTLLLGFSGRYLKEAAFYCHSLICRRLVLSKYWPVLLTSVFFFFSGFVFLVFALAELNWWLFMNENL